jgi:hypothetical protein
VVEVPPCHSAEVGVTMKLTHAVCRYLANYFSVTQDRSDLVVVATALDAWVLATCEVDTTDSIKIIAT